MDWGTFEEVWNRSGDLWVGLEKVEGPSGRSGTRRGTLENVRDGTGDPWGGSGRVDNPQRGLG